MQKPEEEKNVIECENRLSGSEVELQDVGLLVLTRGVS
jgi:hypothetical protein